MLEGESGSDPATEVLMRGFPVHVRGSGRIECGGCGMMIVSFTTLEEPRNPWRCGGGKTWKRKGRRKSRAIMMLVAIRIIGRLYILGTTVGDDDPLTGSRLEMLLRIDGRGKKSGPYISNCEQPRSPGGSSDPCTDSSLSWLEKGEHVLSRRDWE